MATYRHLFSSKLGTLVSEKPWFLTENIDFLTRNLFFGTFQLQQRYQSVWRTHSGTNFYADSESGVKNYVWLLKKVKIFEKRVFPRILALLSTFCCFDLKQRWNDVWRTLSGEFFYADSESRVKNCVLALERVQNLQKIVYFV